MSVEQVGVRRVGEHHLGVGARDVGRERDRAGRVQADQHLSTERRGAEQERELGGVVEQHARRAAVGRRAAGQSGPRLAPPTPDRLGPGPGAVLEQQPRALVIRPREQLRRERSVMSDRLGGEGAPDREGLLGGAAEENSKRLALVK